MTEQRKGRPGRKSKVPREQWKVSQNFTITPEQFKWLTWQADERNVTKSEIVREWLQNAVDALPMPVQARKEDVI